jgi:hypothetical protein
LFEKFKIVTKTSLSSLTLILFVLSGFAEAPFPDSVELALFHCVFVKGDHTNFKIEPSFGVEASELYPDVKYTTVDEYLDQFV